MPAPLDTLPVPTEAGAEALDTVEVVPEPVARWYQSSYWFGPAPWDIGFELGLNGAEGRNQSLSLRTGGHIKRKTEFWKFDNSLIYSRNSSNNIETQNNALLDVRVDRLLGESPWTLYFLNQDLYDEFQAYDLRVSLNAGVGYQYLDTETVDLLGRFGAGASREFGGSRRALGAGSVVWNGLRTTADAHPTTDGESGLLPRMGRLFEVSCREQLWLGDRSRSASKSESEVVGDKPL